MPNNMNADSVLRNLSDDEKVALLTFFHDSWESAAQSLDLGEECERLSINRDALARVADIVGKRWNGRD